MTSWRSNLALLPVLQVLLAEVSVSRAARRLGLTQSAVSQALARARREWGDELLVRQGQRMFPTPLAVELAARLEIWAADTEDLLSFTRRDPTQSSATIIITANDYSEVALLPGVLRTLAARAPNVTVLLRSIEAIPLNSPDFLEGRVHLALAGAQPPPGPFEMQALFLEHFVMIARKGHPALDRPLTLADYLAQRHALVSPQGQGQGGIIDAHLAMLGATRQVRVSLTRFTSLPHLLETSDLVATVPSRFAALPDVRRGCAARDLPFASPTAAMSLIWHRRYRNDPLHVWLRAMICEVLGGQEPVSV